MSDDKQTVTPIASQALQPMLASLATIAATLLGTSTMVSPINANQGKMLSEMLELNKSISEQTRVMSEVVKSNNVIANQVAAKLDSINTRLDGLEKKLAK